MITFHDILIKGKLELDYCDQFNYIEEYLNFSTPKKLGNILKNCILKIIFCLYTQDGDLMGDIDV